MFIPPKCRLAVVAMMDLALHQGQGPVPLSAISARQQVSPSYLDLLFGRLRRSGLVTGLRGPGGGYTLAREATSISLADIVSAADDGGDAGGNGHRSFANRPRGGQSIGAEWAVELEAQMLRQLEETSLDDAIAPSKHLVPAQPAAATPARLPTAKGVGVRERMVVVAANSVFARPMRLAI
ncbi:MAG: Rrf2 family transcriptional regulator [Burkholderiaceae bacterium]|nr:Rrf2 family transcriptional regulator [Rhodoferax sp.]MCB2005142.1 Rrf2 family transcriptional regulator [Rhodoferax sp.]MCB2029143.1 Rrf2 family transcriptional regulator [Rhodoferax sp.]MCB2040510.1 Rrf2 family transcriptional regulator [Rhodoferax sp.]MCP5260411.1 Rrf2 family transcriptional regulator [Rhodoferax sp.]